MLKLQHFGYTELRKIYNYNLFHLFLLLFFNVATGKFSIDCMAHMLFLLDITALDMPILLILTIAL